MYIFDLQLSNLGYHIARDKNIEIYDINLDLLSEMNYNEIEKMNERDLKWLLYIFVCEDKKLREEVYGGNEMMKKVNEKVEDYEKALDAYLFYDKKAIDEAGILQMGRDEKGKEIAKKMLQLGLGTINQIMEVTGLTQDEIEDIQKEEK